jgi:hypothetical protein
MIGEPIATTFPAAAAFFQISLPVQTRGGEVIECFYCEWR